MAESRRKQLFPEVTDQEWNDWKWQVKNRIETLEELKKYVSLTAEEEEGVKKTPSAVSASPPDWRLTRQQPTYSTRCTRMRTRPRPD